MSKAAANLIARSDEVAGTYVRKRYAILFYLLLFTFVASPVLAAFHRRGSSLSCYWLRPSRLPCFPCTRVTRDGFSSYSWPPRWQDGFSRPPLVKPSHQSAMGFLHWWVCSRPPMRLRSALRATSIESEHIYAALSAYLLAGLSFGVLYWALELGLPGSLYYGGGAIDRFSEADGIYFSFVTLATLGYGDFVPKSEVARGLVILEAVLGQLYLGVMVARLVSLYVSGTTAGKQPGPEVR